MAIPTPVNGQITDAVTQANITATGNSPAVAISALYQSMAHSLSILFENSVQAQQQGAITAQAATTMGITRLYNLSGGAVVVEEAPKDAAS